jgi:uncharacterized membrane protein
MKIIGYIIIFWSILNLLINFPRYLAVRKMKRDVKKGLDSQSGEYINSLFAGLTEYDGGLIIVSLGSLSIGVFLALNGATIWQLIGLALLWFSLSGVVQSFRPLETRNLLTQAGDYQTPVNSMAWKLRMISAVELAIGLYLIL